jgi:hypothetical protein
MVFQIVQPGAWIGGLYDSLLGNVGRGFNNQGDVCNFWRSNIVWMYCAGVICTSRQILLLNTNLVMLYIGLRSYGWT